MDPWKKARRRRSRFARIVARDPSPETIARIQRMALRVAKLRGRSKREQALVLADFVEEAGWPKADAIPTGRTKNIVYDVFEAVDVWDRRGPGHSSVFERFATQKNSWLINIANPIGYMVVPTPEYLYNVRAYAESMNRLRLSGKELLAPIEPDLSLVLKRDDKVFWRIFKKKVQPFRGDDYPGPGQTRQSIANQRAEVRHLQLRQITFKRAIPGRWVNADSNAFTVSWSKDDFPRYLFERRVRR